MRTQEVLQWWERTVRIEFGIQALPWSIEEDDDAQAVVRGFWGLGSGAGDEDWEVRA